MDEIITRRLHIERAPDGSVDRISVEFPPKRGRKRWRPIWTRKNARRAFHDGLLSHGFRDIMQIEWGIPPLDLEGVEVPAMRQLTHQSPGADSSND